MEFLEEHVQLFGERVTSLVEPSSQLRSSHVLRALEAGWTSPRDREFLMPILAWVHSALLTAPGRLSLGHDGENSPAYDAVFIGVKQVERYKAALELTGVSAADELQMPSFAKHFVNSVLALYKEAPSHTASSLVKRTVHLSEIALDAVFRALARVEDAGDLSAGAASQDLASGNRDADPAALETLMVLNRDFHHDLHTALRFNRLKASMDRIQSRRSLETESESPVALYPGIGEIMLNEIDETRNIAFSVERYPCTAEVLDPRVVRIPPGKYNNRHKHAHETLFYFVSGTGEILVGETWVQVKSGDAVFSPRWAIHQTHNTGTEVLVLLAITDYYLTNKVYVGKYDKT